MNKIRRKILSYKLIIILLIVMLAGYTGYSVNASALSDDIMDRVAEKIANIILGDFKSETVEDVTEDMLGWSTRDEIHMNSDDAVIYMNQAKTAGIRTSSGIIQCKNASGSWGACSGGTPGDEGWLADSGDTNLIMYPATAADGNQYTVVHGGTATTGDAVFEVIGNTIMDALTASGNVTIGGTLGVTGATTLTGNSTAGGTWGVTGAVTHSSTLAQQGVATFTADPIVGGTTPTLTIGDAGTEDTSLVFDGSAQDFYLGVDDTDDDLKIGAGSAVGTTPAISIADDLATILSGTVNATAAVDFDSTLNVDGAATVAAITGDGNWLTTGNLSAANYTVTGTMTGAGDVIWDTNTLYVDVSANKVGLGTTTPLTEWLEVSDGFQIFDSTSPYDAIIHGYDSADDGVLDILANNSVTVKLHGNATSYFNGGSVGIGTTTSVTAKLSVLQTTEQLRLSYDGSNYSSFTTGSGGDLTIAASGGDIAFGDENLSSSGSGAFTGEMLFAGNVVLGGATTTISATTSAGDLLLTAAQICDGGNDFDLLAGINAGDFTVTLPTATLLAADCLSTGGFKTIWINNNSGDTATITAGTGGDLLEIEGDDLAIGTAHQAEIQIQMLNGGISYRAAVTEWQDAD